MRHPLLGIFASFFVVGCEAVAPSASNATAEQARSTRGAAVAMPDRFGAEAAAAVLEAGGNAIDAAVAAAFVLAVTYPEAGNIGGGGFMLIWADDGPAFVDYRETAPALAQRDMYLDADGEVVPDASIIGELAAGVPGTVAGLWAAHERYGTLPWASLIEPAIELARDGFAMPAQLARRIERSTRKFAGETNFDTYFGHAVEGERFRQPELAATLTRIATDGPDGFYRGETAALIDAGQREHGGAIRASDLEAYQPVWRKPLAADWRDYRVLSAPPPSSGGFAVLQLLGMKDQLEAAFAGHAHNSPQYIHLIAEMEKRVFADRAQYFGDPDFVDVPIDRLIDPAYIAKRAAEVDLETISQLDSVQPGLESPDTTHFSIVDDMGNAVSNTYTLNFSFGCGAVVEGAGFLLNNEMDDFSAKPGVPNAYGVIGGTANAIEPGKRMLSSMSPTILLRDGEPAMVVGTPGGPTIFTSVFQTIVNVLDFEMSPFEATAATRFHHQLLPPDLVVFSPSRPLPDETVAALAARGYDARPHRRDFGDVQVIWWDGEAYQPASDPRGRGVSLTLD